MLEECIIGLEEDIRTVFLIGFLSDIAFQYAFFKYGASHFSVAERMCFETAGEGVHCLESHTVESYAFLECFGVVFTTRVEHRHSFYEFAQRDASSVVSDAGAQMVFYVYLNALAGIHLEFVDTVVNDLFEQHIDTVLCLTAVTQTTDIHAGSGAHMLHIGEVAYIFVAIRHSLTGSGDILCFYIIFFHALRRLCMVFSKTSQIPRPRVLSSSCGCISPHLNPSFRICGMRSAKISVTAPLS